MKKLGTHPIPQDYYETHHALGVHRSTGEGPIASSNANAVRRLCLPARSEDLLMR